MTPGRLARLADELRDEGIGALESSSSPGALIDELDYALHPPRHERRLPTYGAIVLPDRPVERWAEVSGLSVMINTAADRADDDARRYADGWVSFAIRDSAGVSAGAVFDRGAGSERDLVILAEATGATMVQRAADGTVRVVGSFGVARWDGASWHVEPPLDAWLTAASCGELDDGQVLDALLQFAVHDLGAAGIGSILILGPSLTPDDAGGAFEHRLSSPPPLQLDRPTDLGPLRHVLSQVDGAVVFDDEGVLRNLGVRLVPSALAERTVEASGGTRHISARRYSADDPRAVVVAVSDDGPVTVFRKGEIVARSAADDQ